MLSSFLIRQVEAESMLGTWEHITLSDTGCVSSDKKERDVKSTVQVAACPICSVLWKLLYQSGKWSSRRNSHIYIPIFYTETHIARLIKDSSSWGKQGHAENWSEGAYCNAKKKEQMDAKKWLGESHSGSYRGYMYSYPLLPGHVLHRPHDQACLR